MANSTLAWLSSPVLSSPLTELLALPVSLPLCDYVVDRLVDTVSAALDRCWAESQQRCLQNPLLRPFVHSVLTKNKLPVATVLVALVYLDKARKNLRVSPGFWACERALIGAMILANKYTNDDILSTKAWAITSGIFTAKDVVRAERELLHVLRFDLSVREQQILVHHVPLMMRYRQYSARTVSGCVRPTGHLHRARPVRYSPYQDATRPSPPTRHVRKLVTRDSTSSSGSTSPLDSPQLQTPPESHPYFLAAIESDPKRGYYPASHSMPYILTDPKHVPSLDGPMHALNARQTSFGSQHGQSYLSSDRRDFGDRTSAPHPSLLAELLQDLDPRHLSLPQTSEVKPLALTLPFEDTKRRTGTHIPARYTLGENWYLYREQATATPPFFENTVYAF